VSVPTFVVGTGRCGSTMLSGMLSEHPHVLSLSEFFYAVTAESRIAEVFAPGPVDGRAIDGPASGPMSARSFWALVSEPPSLANFGLRQGIETPEILYPYGSPAARFGAGGSVPAILLTALPYLTEDHDHLYDVLEGEVSGWPAATLSEHYRRLFAWLAERFGKRLWVERSGSSLGDAEQYLSLFPDAKFVHLARDGRDAALSMQQHTGFRLGLVLISLGRCLGAFPLWSEDRANLERVPAELRAFLPERFDTNAFDAFRIPAPQCGEFWTRQIVRGMEALRSVPADRLLTLRYEDFFVDPKRQLDALAAFLGDEFVDEAWSARCAATVRPPRSTWRDLPEADARALTEACRPGLELLRDAGVRYEF
jgi:putative sulfotransferase